MAAWEASPHHRGRASLPDRCRLALGLRADETGCEGAWGLQGQGSSRVRSAPCVTGTPLSWSLSCLRVGPQVALGLLPTRDLVPQLHGSWAFAPWRGPCSFAPSKSPPPPQTDLGPLTVLLICLSGVTDGRERGRQHATGSTESS